MSRSTRTPAPTSSTWQLVVTHAAGPVITPVQFTVSNDVNEPGHNSTSGNEYQTFAFKPYTTYDAPADGDTRRYRVWGAHHWQSRDRPLVAGSQPVVDSTGFDRQGDLLAR